MTSRDKGVRNDRALIDLLADKWTLPVLGSLCDNGHRRRFNAIRRDVPGLSQKSLVQCLRRLEQNGLIYRRVITEGRLGVEYIFTDLGLTLQQPVRALFDWTMQYGNQIRAAGLANVDLAAEEPAANSVCSSSSTMATPASGLESGTTDSSSARKKPSRRA